MATYRSYKFTDASTIALYKFYANKGNSYAIMLLLDAPYYNKFGLTYDSTKEIYQEFLKKGHISLLKEYVKYRIYISRKHQSADAIILQRKLDHAFIQSLSEKIQEKYGFR